MTDPSVLIVAKCPNGHETQMFPEKCFIHVWTNEDTCTTKIYWECPVCPRDGYQHQVFI